MPTFSPNLVDSLATIKALENFKRVEFEQLVQKKIPPNDCRDSLFDYFTTQVRVIVSLTNADNSNSNLFENKESFNYYDFDDTAYLTFFLNFSKQNIFAKIKELMGNN